VSDDSADVTKAVKPLEVKQPASPKEQKPMTEEERVQHEAKLAKKREKRKKAAATKKEAAATKKITDADQKEWDDGGYLTKIAEENTKKTLFCHRRERPGGPICGYSLRWLNLICPYCHQKFCTKHALAENHGCGD
jgi:hypothetical protein